MLAVLDSTVLIDFLRGRPAVQQVAELRQRADTPATTSINVEEIGRWLRPGEERAVHDLIDDLVVLVIDRQVAGNRRHLTSCLRRKRQHAVAGGLPHRRGRVSRRRPVVHR